MFVGKNLIKNFNCIKVVKYSWKLLFSEINLFVVMCIYVYKLIFIVRIVVYFFSKNKINTTKA